MRLWNLVLAILVIGIIMGIARDEVGRVAVIIFFTGLGTVVAGLTSIMALFQTIGALGESRSFGTCVEALAATVVVLFVGSATMLGVMFGGGLLIQWAIP
jgi:hypothetical protein